MLRLSNDALELDLLPELGGRVAALRYGGTDILLPLANESFDPDYWPKAGAYPLIPFHNRVRNAVLTCGDRTARLPVHPDTAPHALHGMTSRHPWRGCAETPAVAIMELDWSACEIWPWSFWTEQCYILSGNALTIHLTIENRDCVDMPAGLGWHPYLVAPDSLAEDAGAIWPMNPDYLPTGEKRSPDEADRLSLTRYLSDWTQVVARIGDVNLEITSPKLAHLVIHSEKGRYCCIEPVSHLAGAGDVLPGGQAGSLTKLRPKEQMRASINLRFAGVY